MALIKCKECAAVVSSKAKACPKCGAIVTAKQMGCGTLIGVLIIGMVVFSVSSSIFPPKSRSGSSSTPTEAPKIDKSDKMQTDRAELIARLQAEGIFGDINPRPSGATVMVKPGFYVLDFKEKQTFVSVVHAYFFHDSDAYKPISLNDSSTKKVIGTFTKELGLALK